MESLIGKWIKGMTKRISGTSLAQEVSCDLTAGVIVLCLRAHC